MTARTGTEGYAGVVLAAGEGRRFGSPKALARYQGSLLVERAAHALDEAGCGPVVVILGAAADAVTHRAALSSFTVVINHDWASGMASSLHTAIDYLDAHTDVACALILPVDMPGISASAARRVAAFASRTALAAATFDDRRSHPVLLGREHWSGVRAAATGDEGARSYLKRHSVTTVACDDVAAGFDIDHPHDLWRHNT